MTKAQLQKRIEDLEVEVSHWKALSSQWEKIAHTPAPESETERRSRYLTPVDRNKARLIIAQVARAYGVTPEEIKSLSRREPVSLARSVVMLLLRDVAGFSVTQTGEIIGRTHTNVSKMNQKVRERIKASPQFAKWFRIIRSHAAASLDKSMRQMKTPNPSKP